MPRGEKNARNLGERDALILDLWAEGKTAQQVADAVTYHMVKHRPEWCWRDGPITRSAVLGVVHRAQHRPTPDPRARKVSREEARGRISAALFRRNRPMAAE